MKRTRDGESYVVKRELVKKLESNAELLNALNFTNSKELDQLVGKAKSAKEGQLTWQEFLNFFFLAEHQFADDEHWWQLIDTDGKPF